MDGPGPVQAVGGGGGEVALVGDFEPERRRSQRRQRRKGHGELASAGHEPACLDHLAGVRRRRVLHDEEVGAEAGRDAAPVEKTVERGRVYRGGAQGGRHRHARPAEGRDHAVQVMVLGQGGGIAVVGAEGGPLGTVLHEVGQGPREVPGGGALADEGPHAQAAALQEEFRVGGLVVGAGTGDHVRGQLSAGDTRGVAVDDPMTGQVEEATGGFSGYQPHVVHGLAHTGDAILPEEVGHLVGVQAAGGVLEAGSRDRGGDHDAQVERQTGPRGQVEIDAGPAHDVGDLVRLRQGGGDAVDHEGLGETGRREQGRLRVHVRVDETGDDERPLRVDDWRPRRRGSVPPPR